MESSFLEYSGISKQGRGILEKTEGVGGNGSNRDMGRRKELEKSQRKIPKRVRVEYAEDRKRNRKGRAMGGMAIGIKKKLWERGTRIQKDDEG